MQIEVQRKFYANKFLFARHFLRFFLSCLFFQIQKIDHHRGPVTSVQVSNASDVLVSSSHDATVCLWSLENFSLLNAIQLAHPILGIQISSDSVSVFDIPCFTENVK